MVSNARRRAAYEEYQRVQEAYQDRRNSAADGLGLQYDESQFGQSLYDIENPIERDPQYAREVFSEMGAALRQQLLDTRGLPANQRIHVERRDGSSASAPATIREARKVVTQARVRHNDELYDDRGRYTDDEADSYDDDDDDDDEWEAPVRGSRRTEVRDRYESLEPEPELPRYDDDEDDDDWEADFARSRRSVPARRSPAAPPAHRDAHLPEAPRPRQQPDPRVSTRQVRDRGYPTPEAPTRRRPQPTPDRRQSEPTRRPERPVRRQPDGPMPRQPQAPARVAPSRPEFLGPDGRIPRNPCGQPLYVNIGGNLLAVECHEERRGTAPPWHQNMPHIARIADPKMNAANACFIWYYKEEAPT